MSDVADITIALYDGAYLGSSNNGTNLTAADTTPVSYDGSTAYRNSSCSGIPAWLPTCYPSTLRHFDVTGTDASKYFLRGYVTNERFFPTAAVSSVLLTRPARLSTSSPDLRQHLGASRHPEGWASATWRSGLHPSRSNLVASATSWTWSSSMLSTWAGRSTWPSRAPSASCLRHPLQGRANSL